LVRYLVMLEVRDLLLRLASDGWVVVRQRGSHRQLQHPTKPGTVTVHGHPSTTMPRGTFLNILRAAGLTKEDIQ
jgi:predicted RNA binding protein YcfA (HicA-like mRNA interferase family)